MKINLLLLVFTLSGFYLPAQTIVQWSDSVVITTTPQPITAPRIALLKDGTPFVTWGTSGSPSQIWCARFENGAFTTPVGVVQDPIDPSLFGFGGFDVAVSDSLVFIVFEQIQEGIFLSRSDDGGLTFAPPNLVQGPISGGYATLASVAVDGTGNPLVSYIHDQNGATYKIRRSEDGGINFLDPVTASTPSDGDAVCECCTSDLITSGDSVWLLYRNDNNDLRDIWVSRSTDLAATFDVAADVDATDWHLNFCPIAGPRMARSGDSLMTVWMSSASGVGRVYLSTLHAGTMQTGQQFGFPASAPQAAQSLPDVATSGDTIGMVFLEKSKEILFYFSTNGASNLVNQSTRFAVPLHTLQYPSLAFRDGVFHLTYVDATADRILYRQGKLTESSSISEPKHTSDPTIFPNPAALGGSIRVEMDLRQSGRVSFLLADAIGKIIREFEFRDKPIENQPFELNTKDLSPGIYFLTARLDGEILGTKKVIIR
ncbi:MAG: hypothetical protein Q7T20_17930 [Saprospiraceae bacterium]|nr:hypothetical protein [Saprospiraceae bacterium]